ncbi:MAG: hypothetical protein JNJ58_03370 [Chitinophagaceae bacterium]|nr:hypothetical protein [Chitinophagaceae bacterium]
MIVFVQDNSASQKFAFRKLDSIAYKNQVNEFIQDLEQDYKVKTYSLGSDIHDTLRFNYTEKSTDLSTNLEMLMTTLENENVGSIILSSDGIYNKGYSPLSLQYPFKGAIYTIGLGDSTLQKDALITRVFSNKLVYLGDQFAIRSDMAAYSCKGSTLTMSIFHHNSNRVVASQTMTVNEERMTRTMETIVDAKIAGIQHYTISISKADGEQNIINNSQDIYVEVQDSKENVLLLANSPHPDIFALKEALSKNKNYKVDVKSALNAPNNLSEYNLIVLHNLPSAAFNAGNIIEMAHRNGISIWYFTGSQTAIPLFNKSQTCLLISPRGLSSTDAQAILNKDFSYFTINPASQLNSLPPLSVPFGDFTAGAGTQILMTQKVGSVPTSYPLWMMQQNSQGKTGVTAGEGIWRWRMYDYTQHQNYNLVDEYILKTAQYLSVKNDKRQFRVSLPKSVFTDSEPIHFDAELYNENYELINTPDVTLNISDSTGRKSNYNFNRSNNSYSLNIGSLSEGKYSYTASTVFNGRSHSASGNFRVISLNIEEVNTTADFGMLNQLAKMYGGEFVFANQINTLKEKIKNNPNVKSVIRSDETTRPLIDIKWIFAFLIMLLSIEWFVRKRTGNY